MKNRHISMLLASGILAIVFSCQNNDYIPIEKPSVNIPTTDTVPPVVDTTEVVDTSETEPVLTVYDTIVSSDAHRIVFDKAYTYCCDATPGYEEDDLLITKDPKNPENDIIRPEDAENDCYYNLYGHWSSFHLNAVDSPSSWPNKTIIKLKENTTSKARKIKLSLPGYIDNLATITQLPSQNPETQE